MASCPPGKILNPYTLKCVRVTGRRGRELLKEGAVGEVDVLRQVAYNRPRVRQTVKAPRAPVVEAPCPPGTVRNPSTRRCIKETGRLFRRLQRPGSDVPLRLPLGTAEVAPLGDRTSVLEWATANCSNNRDPLTGISFATADSTTLQELIRLHNRTCTLANPLHTKVTAEHKVGQVATMPGDPRTTMTLDDFQALRNAMRRRIPDYRLPARKHMPPPPNWKLYIASDNRSGPEFASIMYVDVTKARMTAQGPIYHVESVMVDMGFLPIQMDTYTPMMFVDLFRRLDAANRLLLAVPGGWKPVVTPPTKAYWESDRSRKLAKYYADLQASLTAAV
jgi:hypothetical protein